MSAAGAWPDHPGADTPEEALGHIAAYVGRVSERDVPAAVVKVQPSGTPNGRPGARKKVVIEHCTVLGLNDTQKALVRDALGNDAKAPSLELTFDFDVK